MTMMSDARRDQVEKLLRDAAECRRACDRARDAHVKAMWLQEASRNQRRAEKLAAL